MANIKISALPTTGTLLGTHIIPIVDTASATTKTATAQVLLNYVTSSTLNTLSVTNLTGTNLTGTIATFSQITSSYSAQLGSVALPSYSFLNDPNTGIYSPSADTFAISTAGTEAFRVQSNNEVSASGTGGKFVTQLGTVSLPSYTFTGDPNTGIYSPGADTMAFVEGGTEVIRINSSGQVGVGTNAPNFTLAVTGTLGVSGNTTIANGNIIFNTLGKGIDFGATPNSGTTTPNEILNDYEQGTWTPALSGSTTIGSYTYSAANAGTYTKIGNIVHASCYIDVTARTTALTGSVNITGLPFIINGALRAASDVSYYIINTPVSSLSAINQSTTISSVTLYRIPQGGGSSIGVLTGSASDELGASPNFILNITYPTLPL